MASLDTTRFAGRGVLPSLTTLRAGISLLLQLGRCFLLSLLLLRLRGAALLGLVAQGVGLLLLGGHFLLRLFGAFLGAIDPFEGLLEEPDLLAAPNAFFGHDLSPLRLVVVPRLGSLGLGRAAVWIAVYVVSGGAVGQVVDPVANRNAPSFVRVELGLVDDAMHVIGGNVGCEVG